MPVRRMVCVCLFGTRVSLAKTDELIVSRFGGSHVWVQNVVWLGPYFPQEAALQKETHAARQPLHDGIVLAPDL